MPRFRLKHILGALGWVSIALAILNDYVQTKLRMDSYIRDLPPGAWLDWIPRIPTWLCVPLVVAALCHLCGRVRIGLLFGVPAVTYAVYKWVLWHEWSQRMLEIKLARL